MSHPDVMKSGRLHIHPGSVNTVLCSVLRDTGCSSVGIKSSFINPEDFTGETATCVMFDGTECTLPTAHAHIETPCFKGNVVALVLSSPVGVKDSTWRENNGGRYEREPYDTRERNVANVMTRAQKTAEERVNNQDTPVNKSKQKSDSVINFNAIGKLDKHTFRIKQESDRSLDPLRSNEPNYIKKGLLYRHAKKNNSTDQLVVLCSLRKLVLKVCHAIPIAGHMGIGATKKRICSSFT